MLTISTEVIIRFHPSIATHWHGKRGIIVQIVAYREDFCWYCVRVYDASRVELLLKAEEIEEFTQTLTYAENKVEDQAGVRDIPGVTFTRPQAQDVSLPCEVPVRDLKPGDVVRSSYIRGNPFMDAIITCVHPNGDADAFRPYCAVPDMVYGDPNRIIPYIGVEQWTLSGTGSPITLLERPKNLR